MLIKLDRYVSKNRCHFQTVRNGRFTFVPVDDYAEYLENDGLKNPVYSSAKSRKRLSADDLVYVVCLKCGSKAQYYAGEVALGHLKCNCAGDEIVREMKRLNSLLRARGVDQELQDILALRLRRPVKVKSSVSVAQFKKMQNALNSMLQIDFDLRYPKYVRYTPDLDVELCCTVCDARGVISQKDVLRKGHKICNHFALKKGLAKYTHLGVAGGYELHVPYYLVKHCQMLFARIAPSYSVETRLTLFDFPYVNHAHHAPLLKVDATFYDIVDLDDWKITKASGFRRPMPNSSQTVSSLFRLYSYMTKNKIPYKVLLVNPLNGRVSCLSNANSFKDACQEFMSALGK